MVDEGAQRTLAEWLGQVAGWAVAPIVGAGTRLRRTRLIHAVGEGRAAGVVPAPGPLAAVGRRLAGPTLVRLSAALGREGGAEGPDVLGLAIRFHREGDGASPRRGDQDLLFVTSTSVLDLPFAMVRTEAGDFLANEYYGLASFEVLGVGEARLRVRWSAPSPAGPNRAERLARAVAAGHASGVLECRAEGGKAWAPVAEIRLLPAVDPAGRAAFLAVQRLRA